jgi:ABC-type uncharacterized transport system involved in gliding motility auxiliary subunit
MPLLFPNQQKPFTDSEKYIVDQYIMNGGKSLWLIDKVIMDIDSLQNQENATIAYPRDLNLDDLLFKYGIRVNYHLSKIYFLLLSRHNLNKAMFR